MVYSFARISAVLGMNTCDYFQQGRRKWPRIHEKGGKLHDVPVHHKAEEYLDAYLRACSESEAKSPMFERLVQTNSDCTANEPHRRVEDDQKTGKIARLPDSTCCHTWRATGITAYLSNGGSLEHAMRIASHESARTTKLYDRTSDGLSLDEIERIRL